MRSIVLQSMGLERVGYAWCVQVALGLDWGRLPPAKDWGSLVAVGTLLTCTGLFPSTLGI